jgi:hypothetical protein
MAQHIEGLAELTRQIENLGKNFPKPKIRKAVNKGMKIPLKQAKRNAPGKNLKKGLIKIEEPKWKAMKKKKKVVMQIVFDKGMNDIFQKDIPPESRGTRGGDPNSEHAYVPVSVEYGFSTSKNGDRKDGQYFVRKALESTNVTTQETIIESLLQTIDEITNS